MKHMLSYIHGVLHMHNKTEFCIHTVLNSTSIPVGAMWLTFPGFLPLSGSLQFSPNNSDICISMHLLSEPFPCMSDDSEDVWPPAPCLIGCHGCIHQCFQTPFTPNALCVWHRLLPFDFQVVTNSSTSLFGSLPKI